MIVAILLGCAAVLAVAFVARGVHRSRAAARRQAGYRRASRNDHEEG